MIIAGIVTLISYFITQNESVLINGLIIIELIVFGAIIRYRFWADTIMMHVEKWR